MKGSDRAQDQETGELLSPRVHGQDYANSGLISSGFLRRISAVGSEEELYFLLFDEIETQLRSSFVAVYRVNEEKKHAELLEREPSFVRTPASPLPSRVPLEVEGGTTTLLCLDGNLQAHLKMPSRTEDDGVCSDTLLLPQLPEFLQIPLTSAEQGLLAVVVISLNSSDREFCVELLVNLCVFVAFRLATLRALHATDELLDSIADVVNNSLGVKSPYMGEHCVRVPILAEGILDVVSKIDPTEGYRDIATNPRRRRQFILAAKLHDIGKITTPDRILDKDSKLDIRSSRMGEIRTRLEVLSRDYEISLLHAQLRGDVTPEECSIRQQEADQVFRSHLQVLVDLDVGNLAVDDSSKAYAEKLTQIQWCRRFGLSGGASETRSGNGSVNDYLLRKSLELDGGSSEFDLLLCPAGNLTPSERDRIRDHVVQTRNMLSRLKLPDHLSSIPQIAGDHHEALDGSGYPNGKTGEMISLEARILTVADIFEALIAKDRPYKKPRTLKDSLAMMDAMARAGKIDASILRYFSSSGLPQRFVDEFTTG